MGANLLITVILGVVFVALVLWVAVRLRAPRRREKEPIAAAPQPQPEQPIVEAPPQPEPPLAGAPLQPEPLLAEVPTQPEPPLAEAPTPVPEIDADTFAAAEPEVAAPVETAPEPAGLPEPVAPPEPEPQEEVAAAAEPKPKRKRKRPVRRKKKTAGGPKKAQTLGVPAMVHDAYRNIRTWTTSLTPGRALPAILTESQVERGDPTTCYRFKLKQRPYSIVKTDMTGHDGGGIGPLVHEKVQLLDDKGTTLLEMSLITADIGSDETPGDVTVFTEGPWLDDFRELNALSSKDSKRIGSDFRKKFRAKEQVRLKRDFGV